MWTEKSRQGRSSSRGGTPGVGGVLAVPWLSLRPVRMLGWVCVRGWRLYRDSRGRWFLVHRVTRQVRPLHRRLLGNEER